MNDESIFATASALASAAERQAYLDQACAGNAELRAEVEALLRADAGAGSFLNHPPVGAEATIAMSGEHDTVDDGAGPVTLSFLQPCETPGRLGKLIGKGGEYEVIEVVGQGGMGAVVRAFDSKLSRIVAVKIMAPELAANPMAVKRFLREAKTAAAIHHEHVVTIHAIEEAHRPPFIVMQFVEGQNLQQKLDAEGALELKQILRIGSQVAAGLAAAHKQGLIHRDVKPANILLENGVERVKITDFGLARAADDMEMTQAGLIAGTPQYMSPEQAKGEPVDARSDLFSLGSVLYTMCTGRPAFRAETTMGVLKRVCEDTPRPILEVNAETPPWLEAIVMKLLAKDPADRFQSATEVAELLSQHLAHVQNPSLVAKPATVIVPPPPPVRLTEPFSKSAPWCPPGTHKGPSVAVVIAIIVGSILIAPALLVMIGLLVPWLQARTAAPATRQGIVSLRLNDPRIEFRIDGYGANQTAVSVLQVPLEAGEHHVWFKFGNLELDTGSFNVVEGQQHTLELEISAEKAGALWDGQPLALKLVAGNPPQGTLLADGTITLPADWPTTAEGIYQLAAKADGFVPLFNGQDLTGWKVHPFHENKWKVEAGELVGTGGLSNLFTERGEYRDFVLRLEGRISNRGNSGVMVRSEYNFDFDVGQVGGTGRLPRGMEVDLHPGVQRQAAGSVWHLGTPHWVNGASPQLIRPDQWFTMLIIVQGKQMQVRIDGKIVLSGLRDEVKFASGHIALLQQFTQDGEVRFRKIEIKELPDSGTDARLIQGAWKAIEGQVAGRPWPELNKIGDYKLVFDGDKFRHTFPGAGELMHDGTYQLSPQTEPNQITLFFNIPGARPHRQGIYRFEGERLRLNMGTDRPSDFATQPGDESGYMVLLERDSLDGGKTAYGPQD